MKHFLKNIFRGIFSSRVTWQNVSTETIPMCYFHFRLLSFVWFQPTQFTLFDGGDTCCSSWLYVIFRSSFVTAHLKFYIWLNCLLNLITPACLLKRRCTSLKRLFHLLINLYFLCIQDFEKLLEGIYMYFFIIRFAQFQSGSCSKHKAHTGRFNEKFIFHHLVFVFRYHSNSKRLHGWNKGGTFEWFLKDHCLLTSVCCGYGTCKAIFKLKFLSIPLYVLSQFPRFILHTAVFIHHKAR